MARFQSGTIQEVNLKDDDVNILYSIKVLMRSGRGVLIEAFPLDVNVKRIPIMGEQVIVIKSQSPESDPKKARSKNYYLHPVPVQLNVHNNSLPTAHSVVSTTSGGNYGSTSAGNPNTSGGESDADLGDGFVERTDVSSLQPFLGDLLIEGRFGHSLRFGYSPEGADTTKDPSWNSPTPEDPITILSNGRKSAGSYNKFIIENVDEDLSSIWLTSSQKLKLKTSNKLPNDIKSQSEFDEPSIILNSNRVVLNSKSDYIILSGAKSVALTTPSWAMDMDKLFTIIEGLIQQLADLTAGAPNGATFATGVGPTGPATNVADVQKLLTDLKAMAQ
jgi:hypothetical protein